jgi:nucleotide-binding universal stress UspA family protein
MPRTRRIVAGVSNSPGNLPALRHAADLARVYDAALTFVHAWLPSGPEFAAWPFPSDPLVLQWQDAAWQRMWHALDTAFGGLPPDLEAEPLVMRGSPGPVLVGTASRDGDRLVVGAGRRGTFGRFRHGKVSRYCLAHAGCPVIAVPSPALDRAAVRAARTRHARVPDLTTAGRAPGPWFQYRG